MAYLIAQGGASLYKMDLTTGVATALTLPTGVTIDSTRKPRFAVLNNWVALVNSPSRNLVIDPEGTVRVMVPRPPTHGPTLAGSGTGLTGAYQMKVSYVVLNSDGELLMESPLSPTSASFTAANQSLSVTRIAQSTDDITNRRLYRTSAGGSTYFQLMDIEGNVATAVLNGTADASLSLLPALSATLTTPPGTVSGVRMKMITEWKSRLWGVADDLSLLDTVFISETNKVYAWPNSIIAFPTGQDGQGIIGFAARKNQLGLLKRTGVVAIIGASGSTGIALGNMQIQQLTNPKETTAGTGSPDTIVVVNDAAYWLGNDGVYEWTDAGLKNISRESVHPWFTTDTYFNRSQFANAFAKYNKRTNSYELHLPNAGSSNIDRWVSFNLTNREWYGPHQTAAFTPSHAAHLMDDSGLPIALVGGTDGVVYVANQSTFRDGASSIIDFDCYGPFHNVGEADYEKHWGQLSMLTKIESGGTLSITPYVGRLDAAAQTAISADLTKGREVLRRLGDGAYARLRMRQNTLNQNVTVYGYEVNPVFVNGRR